MESHQVRYLLTLQVKFLVGDPCKGHEGHSRSPTVFLPITWDPNEIETWDWCHCVCLRKAHRMMYNLTTWVTKWPCPDLPWCQILTFTFQGQIIHVATRLDERQTRWYQNRCSTFKIKDFIVQKTVLENLEFWPLVISILTWAQKWPLWFRNDFSRAFERRFPFCSTLRRSRDRRGGCSNTPPHQVVENPEAHQGAG